MISIEIGRDLNGVIRGEWEVVMVMREGKTQVLEVKTR